MGGKESRPDPRATDPLAICGRRLQAYYPRLESLAVERRRLESDPSPAAQEQLHAVLHEVAHIKREAKIIMDEVEDLRKIRGITLLYIIATRAADQLFNYIKTNLAVSATA